MNGRDTEPRGTSYPSDRRGCQISSSGSISSDNTLNCICNETRKLVLRSFPRTLRIKEERKRDRVVLVKNYLTSISPFLTFFIASFALPPSHVIFMLTHVPRT